MWNFPHIKPIHDSCILAPSGGWDRYSSFLIHTKTRLEIARLALLESKGAGLLHSCEHLLVQHGERRVWRQVQSVEASMSPGEETRRNGYTLFLFLYFIVTIVLLYFVIHLTWLPFEFNWERVRGTKQRGDWKLFVTLLVQLFTLTFISSLYSGTLAMAVATTQATRGC